MSYLPKCRQSQSVMGKTPKLLTAYIDHERLYSYNKVSLTAPILIARVLSEDTRF
jgi:hypothetical protein